MTDLRRSVLWVVFSMSLLLLWDAWQVHQGRSVLAKAGAQLAQPVEGAGWHLCPVEGGARHRAGRQPGVLPDGDAVGHALLARDASITPA